MKKGFLPEKSFAVGVFGTNLASKVSLKLAATLDLR